MTEQITKQLPKQTYTVPEVSQVTGLCRAYIYILFKEGKLKKVKAGKRTLVKAEDLKAYIDSLSEVAA